MRLDTSMTQRMDQKMILAPRMIQSMEILQLPIMALQERIQQELQENPVLELKEASPEEAAGEEEVAAVAEADKEAEEDPFDLEDFPGFEDHFQEEHRRSRNGLDEEGDKKHDAMQNMAS